MFLVALGIDYNIFLMTRVREETQTRGTREGSLVALAATGGVITSAGLVLASTFLVLGTMPLVAFVEIGVAVALGVLLDTLVVQVGAGHRAQPRPGQPHLVAEQARSHHRLRSRRLRRLPWRRGWADRLGGRSGPVRRPDRSQPGPTAWRPAPPARGWA